MNTYWWLLIVIPLLGMLAIALWFGYDMLHDAETYKRQRDKWQTKYYAAYQLGLDSFKTPVLPTDFPPSSKQMRGTYDRYLAEIPQPAMLSDYQKWISSTYDTHTTRVTHRRRKP